MKLATTTGDFSAYSRSQTDCIEWIHQSGFRYLDYNFGTDFADHSGSMTDEWKSYLASNNVELYY